MAISQAWLTLSDAMPEPMLLYLFCVVFNRSDFPSRNASSNCRFLRRGAHCNRAVALDFGFHCLHGLRQLR